jgi:hypothetical protein
MIKYNTNSGQSYTEISLKPTNFTGGYSIDLLNPKHLPTRPPNLRLPQNKYACNSKDTILTPKTARPDLHYSPNFIKQSTRSINATPEKLKVKKNNSFTIKV